MLNHLAKILLFFVCALLITACHKAAELDNTQALKLLSTSNILPGYTVSMVTNNPNAHGKDPSGWRCADKQHLVDADVVTCNESGRSGVYLKFTDKGKNLLIGKPWGDGTLRNARVIAVSQHINKVENIQLVDETHAIVHYTWTYDEHTPFSNDQLRKTIALNIPQTNQVSMVIDDDQWVIEQ